MLQRYTNYAERRKTGMSNIRMKVNDAVIEVDKC